MSTLDTSAATQHAKSKQNPLKLVMQRRLSDVTISSWKVTLLLMYSTHLLYTSNNSLSARATFPGKLFQTLENEHHFSLFLFKMTAHATAIVLFWLVIALFVSFCCFFFLIYLEVYWGLSCFCSHQFVPRLKIEVYRGVNCFFF